jgi:hypothetical protein
MIPAIFMWSEWKKKKISDSNVGLRRYYNTIQRRRLVLYFAVHVASRTMRQREMQTLFK